MSTIKRKRRNMKSMEELVKRELRRVSNQLSDLNFKREKEIQTLEEDRYWYQLHQEEDILRHIPPYTREELIELKFESLPELIPMIDRLLGLEDATSQDELKEDLSGWAEIAKALGVAVRTAKNWEKEWVDDKKEKSPIIRKGRVIKAKRSELIDWRKKIFE